MEDVLDLYAEPHNSLFPVVCFDERPCFLLADVLTLLHSDLASRCVTTMSTKRKGVLICSAFSNPRPEDGTCR